MSEDDLSGDDLLQEDTMLAEEDSVEEGEDSGDV